MLGGKAINEIPMGSRSSWEGRLTQIKVGWEKCDNGDTAKILLEKIKGND